MENSGSSLGIKNMNTTIEGDKSYKKLQWAKILLPFLIIGILAIGLASQKKETKFEKLQDNILYAVNSSLIIKEQSYGIIMFDLEEREEITQTDIIAENIIQCESSNQMKWGDLHLPIHAYGVAQFQFRTFEWLKGLAQAPSLNFYKEDDQVWLLKWAIDNGYLYLWSCAKLLGYN